MMKVFITDGIPIIDKRTGTESAFKGWRYAFKRDCCDGKIIEIGFVRSTARDMAEIQVHRHAHDTGDIPLPYRIVPKLKEALR